MTPFVVGRESSVRALEEAMLGDKKIFLATQHDASIDEPKPNEIYQRRHHRQHRPEPEAAGRQHQGAGGGRGARQGGIGRRRRGLLPRRGPYLRLQSGDRAATRRPHRPRDRAVRAVRQAQPEPELRDHDRRHPGGRSLASLPIPSAPTCSSPSRKSRNCSRSSIPSTA